MVNDFNQILKKLSQHNSCAREPTRRMAERTSGVSSPTIYSRYANLKVLLLFISLEIDCFHSQSTVNICIFVGLNLYTPPMEINSLLWG